MPNHTCPNCGKYKILKNTWCSKCAKKLDPRYIAWSREHVKKYQQTPKYKATVKKYRQSESYKKILAKSRAKNHDEILARERARYHTPKVQIKKLTKQLEFHQTRVVELFKKIKELEGQNG